MIVAQNAVRLDYCRFIDKLLVAINSPYMEMELLGSFSVEGNDYPMYAVKIGSPSPDKLNVLISAGIHGDEPAGVAAALSFIEHNTNNPVLLSHYSFVVFPCNNPYGWERGTRENSDGLDLNRQFKVRNPAPEVQFIINGLENKHFDLIYEMHEDYDSPGFYLYELCEEPVSYLGEAIIHEISTFGYPINRNHIIERRIAKHGIIRPNAETYRKTRLPHLYYSYRRHGGQVLTLETPSTILPLADRVRMHLLGLNVSLNRAWLDKDAMNGI